MLEPAPGVGHTSSVNAPERQPIYGPDEHPEQVKLTQVVRVPARERSETGLGDVDSDHLAVEEPLEIRLGYGPLDNRRQQSLAVTMRTPGDDEELVLGFLFTEGIVAAANQVRSIGPCGEDPGANVIRAEIDPGTELDLDRLRRHFYTSSSCGVCGKQSLEAVRTQGRFAPSESPFRIAAEQLQRLPARLLETQAAFAKTGGIHAAALFDADGRIHAVREDVGRHNALDKLIGRGLREGLVPLRDFGILVSGRASFELLQKAMMAGGPVFAAIGAPSSLAVAAAQEFGIALAGFVRGERFNVYAGGERFPLEAQEAG